MSTVNSTSSSTNVLRITGMASGLDVDSMVEKLMKAEQVKVDKVKQQQQIIEWKQEAYQDIIKDIKDLQSSFFDSLSSDKNILSSSNFAGFDTNVTDPTAASVVAGVGSKTGNYSIRFGADGQLASGAKKTGTQLAAGTLRTTKFSELGGVDTTVNLTYNGTSKTIDIKATDTITDIINNISTTTSGNVNATFSELTGQFSIETSNSGSSTTINIDEIGALGLSTGEEIGKDAIVYITPPGGVATKVTKSSNNFTIDGINYNLLSKKDTTFSVTQNTTKVYDKLKGFIDKYNAIIDKIQTKLTEKKELSYKPLTDDQKESMKDTEIANWEAKAKKGILKNDEKLQGMLNDLRSAFTTSVDGTSISMSKYGSNSIGLDYSSDYKNPGRIEIKDDSKLKEAISTQGDQILKFFTNVSTNTALDTDGKTIGYHESGVFARIKNILEDNVGLTNTNFNTAILTKYANVQDDFSKSGGSGKNTLPDQIYQKQLLINQLNKSLSVKQENYYQKFAKLETAMNKLNAQQSSLLQQLDS